MGIKNIRHIIGAMILISVITGCTQVTPDGKEAPVAKKPTEITLTEVTETPKPTSSPTPLPTLVAGQALQVYRTMLIIQANAEQLQEAAILADPQEVELNLKESPMMMSLSVSIVTVNDLMSNVQAPNTISLPWNRAHLVHQETERVLQSWLMGESTSSQIIEALVPVIEDIRRDVGLVEEALVSEYGYDRTELDQERLMVLEVMQQMLGGGEQ